MFKLEFRKHDKKKPSLHIQMELIICDIYQIKKKMTFMKKALSMLVEKS